MSQSTVSQNAGDFIPNSAASQGSLTFGDSNVTRTSASTSRSGKKYGNRYMRELDGNTAQGSNHIPTSVGSGQSRVTHTTAWEFSDGSTLASLGVNRLQSRWPLINTPEYLRSQTWAFIQGLIRLCAESMKYRKDTKEYKKAIQQNLGVASAVRDLKSTKS
jgi:hypothetical protein